MFLKNIFLFFREVQDSFNFILLVSGTIFFFCLITISNSSIIKTTQENIDRKCKRFFKQICNVFHETRRLDFKKGTQVQGKNTLGRLILLC